MNKEQTEEKLKLLIAEQELKFCPLIINNCRKDCECFGTSTWSVGIDTFDCTAYCNNNMFVE